MRDRAWRRYVEEKVVKKRINLLITASNSWWRFYNVNGSKTAHPTITDHLSTKEHFNAKTLTTDSWTSKHKTKYSSNKSKTYYRNEGRNQQTREFNKRYLLKVLKENGLK